MCDTCNQTPNGRAECRGSNVHRNTINWMDSMGNQWSSSGEYSFPGHTTLQILQQIQKLMRELNCEQERFQEELYLCRCTTTSHWETRKTNAVVWQIQLLVVTLKSSPWDIGRAQRMGLKFYQTRSIAIILHDTLPPVCIERVVSRKNGEILYTRISKSPRLAHTVTLKAN